MRNVVGPSAAAGVLLSRVCGVLFIALGLRLAASKW
jgi:threonine/homoserine/homoserine lactone efflux protein